MKEQLITEVQQQMLPYLNNEQLRKLRAAMEFCLHGTVHFLTPKDIQGLKHITNTERRITDAGLQKVKGSALPPRAVCVSCIGNIGYTGMTTQKCVTNQQINSIIVNSDNDPDFVYYLIYLRRYFQN